MEIVCEDAESCSRRVSTASCQSGRDLTPSSDSEEDVQTKNNNNDDAMLGALERGLSTISRHAKVYMDNCKTDENRKNMQSRLEKSMLGLLKSEQVVKEIPMLVTEVVDDFVDNLGQDGHDYGEEDELDYFKPMWPINELKMGQMSQAIFKLFDQKVKDFTETLTEDKLKEHPQFMALEEQVSLSLSEADSQENPGGAGDAFLSALDLTNTETKFYDPDELSDDELMLPNIDPLTKEPMIHPVRNKFCNHVFEERSVRDYIRTNPNPMCPLGYCRNEKPFQADHFMKVPKLTEQVRRKNMRDQNRS